MHSVARAVRALGWKAEGSLARAPLRAAKTSGRLLVLFRHSLQMQVSLQKAPARMHMIIKSLA